MGNKSCPSHIIPNMSKHFYCDITRKDEVDKVLGFSQNEYHGSFKYALLLLSSSSQSSSVSECTVCQVRPSPVGLCGDGNKTCLHVLPLTIPRNSRQFFLRPKSYGLMQTLFFSANRFVSALLIFASMLVSPLLINLACHSVRDPNAINTPETRIVSNHLNFHLQPTGQQSPVFKFSVSRG